MELQYIVQWLMDIDLLPDSSGYLQPIVDTLTVIIAFVCLPHQ